MPDLVNLGFRVDSRELVDADNRMDALDKSGQRVENRGKGISTGFSTLAKAAATAAGALGLGAMIATARDFEASMNDVEEKLGGTADEMEALRQKALEMGASTAFSASQSADAMSSLAAKGLETTEIISVLPDVMSLASAAQLTLEESAKLTTATMNQFNLGVEESTRVVDLLAAVGDSSGATIQGLEASLKKAGPAANAYGVSLESTAAAIAILANNSIEAEVAGTAIAGMFSKLMVATGDGEKALAKYNLTSADFIKIGADGSEQFIGYADAIQILSDKQVTATDVSRIFGLEAGKNLVPLVAAGAGAIRDMEASFFDASSAIEQANTQMKGLPGSWRNAASAWEGFQLALMSAGGTDLTIRALDTLTAALRIATGFINDAADIVSVKWGEFKDAITLDENETPTTLTRIADAVRAIGTRLTPLIPYLDDFAIAVVGIGAGAAAIAALGAAFALLTSPITLTVAAVAGLAVAANQMYQNWDAVAVWWAGMWSDIRANADTFVAWWARTTFSEKVLTVSDTAIGAAESVSTRFFAWWNSSSLKEIAPQFAVDGIAFAEATAKRFFSWWNATSLREKIADIKSGGIETVERLSRSFFNWWNITTLREKVLQIADTGLSITQRLANTFFNWWNNSTLKKLVPEVVVDGLAVAEQQSKRFFNWWNNTTIREKILYIKEDGMDAVISSVRDGIRELTDLLDFDQFKDFAGDLMGSMADGIRNYDFSNIGAAIGSGLARVATTLISFGIDMAMSLGQGVTKGTTDYFRDNSLLDLFGSIFGGVIDLISGFVSGFGNTFSNEFRRLDLAKGLQDAFASVFAYTLSLPARMADIAGDIIDGLIEGLGRSGRDRLISVVKGIADLIPDWIRRQLGIASPSRVMIEIGGHIIDGLIKGIEQNVNSVIDAVRSFVNELGDTFSREFEKLDLMQSMQNAFSGALDYLELLPGTMALYALDMVEGLIRGLSNFGNSITVAIVEGFSGAFDYLRALPANMARIGLDIIDGLVQGIVTTGRDKITDTVKNLANLIPQGFRDFLDIQSPSKVMRQIGVFVADGLAEGIRDGAVHVSSAVSGLAKLVTDASVALADGISNSIGSASNIREGLDNLGDHMANWLQEQITHFAANKILAFVGLGDGGLDGIGSIGKAFTGLFGSAAGGADDLAASIGSMESQSLGAASSVSNFGTSLGAVGVIFGAGSVLQKITAEGTALGKAFGTGDFARGIRNAVAAARSMQSFAEEGPKIVGEIGDMMRSLGVEVSDELTDSIYTEMFSAIETAGGDISQRLEASLLTGYTQAFNSLTPGVRSGVESLFDFDIDSASIEDIAQVFAEMTQVVEQMRPALEETGILLGKTGDDTLTFAIGLAESMGGAGEAIEALTLYAEEFVPASNAVGEALAENTRGLTTWNEEVSGTDHYEAANAGLTAFRAHVIDQYEQMYGPQAVQYLDVAGAAMLNQQSALNDYTFSLDTSTAAGVLAAEQVAAFTTRIDTATGQLEVNDAALFNYIGSLDTSTAAGQAAYESAMQLADSLGVTAESTINTRDEMFRYVESLQAQHEAGQLTTDQFTALTAAALEQLPAIIAVEDHYLQQVATLNSVADAANTLNLKFDETSPLALQASEALVEMMGGIDGFTSATNSYYNEFYTAKEREQIELANSAIAVENFNNSLVLAGGSAITSKDQFREYVESLDLTTFAGQQAFAAAMEVSQSMFAVTEAGGDVNQIMSEMPENLRTNFNEMTSISDQGAGSIIGSFTGMFNEATGMAEGVKGVYGGVGQGFKNLVGDIESITTQSGLRRKDKYKANADAIHNIEVGAGIRRIQNAANQSSAISRVYVDSGNKNIQTSQKVASHASIAQGRLFAYADSLDRSANAGRGAYAATINQTNALNGFRSASSTATGGFYNVRNSLNSAASSAQSAASRFSSASNSIWSSGNRLRALNNWYSSGNNFTGGVINGSHMLGLDYVPFDGYIAELHKGERVLTKEDNTRLTDGLEFRPINNVSVSPAAVRPASNDNSYVAKELGMIRQELAEIKNNNASAADSNNIILQGISNETSRQTGALQEGNKIDNRRHRRNRINRNNVT